MIRWQNHIAGFVGAHRYLDPSFKLVSPIAVFSEAILWTTQPEAITNWTNQTASSDVWTEQTASIDTWTPQ